MFEPPMERCPVCGEYVVLVQAQQECASRQQCGNTDACPLKSAFATTDFYRTIGDAAAPPRPGG
jgi:transcription elongation factor Elf1